MTDSGYVLKNSEGLYYTGLNSANKQLRKAKIYHDTKYAEAARDEINNHPKRIAYAKHDFELIEIEIKEILAERRLR